MPAQALAGKNASGALVVHAADTPSCSFFADFCGEDFPEPNVCENAGTEAYPSFPVWFLASFWPGQTPGVSQIIFGIEHNLNLSVDADWWGPCNPEEQPDPGWPHDPGAGNTITFPTPVVGDLLFPFYVFCVVDPNRETTSRHRSIQDSGTQDSLATKIYRSSTRLSPSVGFAGSEAATTTARARECMAPAASLTVPA
jgi:hypothetical protein